MTEIDRLSPVTRAVRAGIATDAEHGAVVPPIHLSSTFAFEGFNRPRKYDYTRSGNPTRSQLASALTELEGGAAGVVTSTGMSAVALVLHLLRPGDTVVAAHDCYGGTQRLLRALAGRGHFAVEFVDLTASNAAAQIAERAPRIVWIETPSNPLLRITDILAISAAAHAVGALAVVDNTFLSPALQQPLSLGADVVVHSTTKYLNGHSDVVGGAVIAADAALGAELAWWANCLGITGAPFDSFLTLRGVRTLHPRMLQHLAGAEAVVDTVCGHPAVERVYYPGLPTHPGHALARAQQRGFGAMVSFEISGGVAGVELFTSHLRCFSLAESLGGVESLVAHPATMTHASMEASARTAAGISDSLLRLSVGIEAPEDLSADLTRALDRVLEHHPPRQSRRGSAVTVSRTDSAPAADIVLLGVGVIGRELLAQFDDCATASRFRICGLVDRSGWVADANGIPSDALRRIRAAKAGGQHLALAPEGNAGTAADALASLTTRGLVNPILVDATAADTTPLLEIVLDRGWDVVLANKIPLVGDRATTARLHRTARAHGRQLLHEATVGAGLPVMDTLRKLVEAGDEVLAIEGCPSGTLGFLFGEMERGASFSRAVRTAIAAGFTEPDPRIDLRGTDVARKALILGRALGFDGELGDIEIESLVPASVDDTPDEDLLARLEACDDAWEGRVRAARGGGRVLRYRVRVTKDAIAVGLVAVAAENPLARLSGTDNQFAFTTRRYRDQPLVITGPGAGAAVTAGGVYNDLLKIVAERRVSRSRTFSPRAEVAAVV
jgi:cystathionine gamma-synthase